MWALCLILLLLICEVQNYCSADIDTFGDGNDSTFVNNSTGITETIATTEIGEVEENIPWQINTTSTRSRLEHLLKSETFSDVTFLVGPDRTEFRAHSLILSMSSPVMENDLYDNNQRRNTNSSILEMFDTDPDIFQLLLSYVYKDDDEMASSYEAQELRNLAIRLEMNHLAAKTYQYISNNLDNGNVLQVIRNAAAYYDTQLEGLCLRHIDKYASDVLHHTDFSILPESVIIKISSSPILNATEIDLFNAVLYWSRMQSVLTNQTLESIRQELAPILPLINFDKMTPEEFVKVVVPARVLNATETNKHLGYFIQRFLPKSTTSNTRVQEKMSAQAVCKRSLDSDVSSYRSSSTQSHIIGFRAKCTERCFLSGFKVTESFTTYSWGLSYKALQLTATIEDLKTSEVLFHFESSLTHPFKVVIETPIEMKSEDTYVIRLNVEAFQVARGDYGFQYCSHCLQNISCDNDAGTVLEFIDYPEAKFTNSTHGLISELYFVH